MRFESVPQPKLFLASVLTQNAYHFTSFIYSKIFSGIFMQWCNILLTSYCI